MKLTDYNNNLGLWRKRTESKTDLIPKIFAKRANMHIQLIIISMNKYEVLGVIDEGAYGIVLKATVRETDQFGN
jgi:hypothetical protein